MAEMELAQEGAQNQGAVVADEVGKETPPTEKMLSQSEVDRIVSRTREKTREHYYNQGKQDALNDYQKSQETTGGVSQEQLEKLVEDKITERANQEYGQRVAQDFIGKLKAAEGKYPDFNETVAQLNLDKVPQLVSWANSLDNTADVIYDMAKNPSKFASILSLSFTSPHLAQSELSKLSSSIKKNSESNTPPSINPPLSQINPSTVGTDNGKMGIRDLRKQPWLRA